MAMALKAQQGLRAASDCQATEKASEDVGVKSEVDRRRVLKLWQNVIFSKMILDKF